MRVLLRRNGEIERVELASYTRLHRLFNTLANAGLADMLDGLADALVLRGMERYQYGGESVLRLMPIAELLVHEILDLSTRPGTTEAMRRRMIEDTVAFAGYSDRKDIV